MLLLAFFFNGFCRLLFHILFAVSWLSHFFPPEQSIDVSARKLHGFGAFLQGTRSKAVVNRWKPLIIIDYHRLSQMASKES